MSQHHTLAMPKGQLPTDVEGIDNPAFAGKDRESVPHCHVS
jgi:hypothetical protein